MPALAVGCATQATPDEALASGPEIAREAEQDEGTQEGGENVDSTSQAVVNACASWNVNAATGQRCPLKATCNTYADCGIYSLTTTQKWYCSGAGVCEFSPSTSGNAVATGSCGSQLLFRQVTKAPWDKTIVPPDGVNFREATTLAFDVTNQTSQTVYLDKVPMTLEISGTNASQSDVYTVKVYDGGALSDFGTGPLQYVCSSGINPFSSSLNGTTGPCAFSSASRIDAGKTKRFVFDLTFANNNKINVGNRNYRLNLNAAAGVQVQNSGGLVSTYSACSLPAAPVGAWVRFRRP